MFKTNRLSNRTPFVVACAILFSTTLLLADQAVLKDGSVINGTITKIEGDNLFLQTSFAGELIIPMLELQTLESDQAIELKLRNGKITSQKLDASDAASLISQIVAAGTAVTVPEPTTAGVSNEPVAEPVSRIWKFEGAVGLSGKSGNSNKDDFSGSLKAVMENDDQRLEFALRYHLSETELSNRIREKTTDESIASANYTSFFTPSFGWFFGQSLERDRFENIELRSLTAAGITWKALDAEKKTLELSAGLANRYESYGFDLNADGLEDKVGSENLPGIDFSLKFKWLPADWAEWNTSLSINPVFEDLSNYQIDHLSTLDIPLGASDLWKLRVSVSNQYRSIVTTDTEKLDTTYALSLLLKWM